GLAFSPDGKRLASAARAPAGTPEEVKLWDVASGRQQAARGLDRADHWMAFAPDGWALVAKATERDGEDEVTLWDPATGRRRSLPVKPRLWLTAGGLSPDGRLLALGYDAGGDGPS